MHSKVSATALFCEREISSASHYKRGNNYRSHIYTGNLKEPSQPANQRTNNPTSQQALGSAIQQWSWGGGGRLWWRIPGVGGRGSGNGA